MIMSNPGAASGDLSTLASFKDTLIVSRESSETSVTTLSVETVTAPIVAANQIILKAENCPNSKIVGILVEEHHHYGSTNGNGSKEQQGNIFQPDRNTLAKLISRYKEEGGWMYPLPWEQNLKLEPEEFYVELTLDAYSKNGLISKGIKANVEDIFDPLLPGGLPVQRVLIQGNAGYGKSSLCQKTVYDWSHGVTTIRELPWNFSLPVLIKLRFLDEDSILEELILQLIASHYSPTDKVQNVKSFVRCLGRQLIIILDGYDELDEGRQDHVKSVLQCWKSEDSLLSCASLLVTTRPTLDDNFLLMFEKHYFIGSISESNVEILIKKFNTYTCSSTDRCVSTLDRFFSKINWYPETHQLEKCLSRHTRKAVNLRDMSPLIIAVFCWIVKQPRVEFRSNDIIYNCIELLSKRCNQREKFGFTDEHVGEILFKFGLLCFKMGNTFISGNLDRTKLGFDFPFLALTGIFKRTVGQSGLTLWVPVHKSFIDSLVDAALVCDEVDSFSRREIKEFLNSDVTTSCGPITLHVSPAVNHVLVRGTEISYHSQKKTAFLKWNDKFKNVSFKHNIEAPDDLPMILNIKYFNTESLETFTKDFSKFLPVVKESNPVQVFLNEQGNKLYKMSLGLKASVEDSLELFFPGTQNVLTKLLTYGIRFITIKRQGNVNFREKFLDRLLGLSDEYAKHRSPSAYFSEVNCHLGAAGLDDWEITVHFIVNSEGSQHSHTLKYNPVECPKSHCRWENITKVKVVISFFSKLYTLFPPSSYK